MKLLRTIRMDDTDTAVFETAAAPGEIAVSGAFLFSGIDPARLPGKLRQALRHGFLGTESFGWSTFVAVASCEEALLPGLIESLAARFLDGLGAPSMAAAREAADGELRHAISLAEHPVNTLLAVEREVGEQGIIERFRTIAVPRPQMHANRIWDAHALTMAAADEAEALPSLARLAAGGTRRG